MYSWYFTFFVAIVNGVSIAVISFVLLFEHGNAINFWVLSLYLATFGISVLSVTVSQLFF